MKSKIMMKLSTIAMLFLVGIGFVGNTVSMSASSTTNNDKYIYESIQNLSPKELNEIYNNGPQPRAILTIGTMIAVFKASWTSWQTCSTIARGMGMGGCGQVIAGGYNVIKSVFVRM